MAKRPPPKNMEAYLDYQKKRYHANKSEYRWRMVKIKYGITEQDFNEMLEEQKFSCALCEKPFTSMKNNDLHIDHCHETNKVRGLLCMKCNVGLGMLGDNEEGLLRALSYVKGD
jgi:hypothetical protein